jgi:predicted regulator of Ras-like GTPase activity (Roadblock/LC7/MglB family)
VTTSFTPILQRIIERVPGAVAAIFADADGESVDHFSTQSADDTLVMGAHFGIVLHHVQLALRTFHYGDPQEMIMSLDRMDVIVRSVGLGYYLLLAIRREGHLATALREAETAAHALRTEMY